MRILLFLAVNFGRCSPSICQYCHQVPGIIVVFTLEKVFWQYLKRPSTFFFHVTHKLPYLWVLVFCHEINGMFGLLDYQNKVVLIENCSSKCFFFSHTTDTCLPRHILASRHLLSAMLLFHLLLHVEYDCHIFEMPSIWSGTLDFDQNIRYLE